MAATFFIITNPIGNAPAIMLSVKNLPMRRQRYILFREGIIAFALGIFFQYFGEVFLGYLHLQPYTVAICGGFLLFLVAIDLIFPDHSAQEKEAKQISKKEPCVVPIATPLLAGPGLLTILMVYSQGEAGSLSISAALTLNFIGVFIVLGLTPYLKKLGKKGITALEQLMGMFLAMIGTGLVVKGASLFVATLK